MVFGVRWVIATGGGCRRTWRRAGDLSPTSLSVSLLAFTSLDFMTLSSRTFPPLPPPPPPPPPLPCSSSRVYRRRPRRAFTRRVPHNIANWHIRIRQPSIDVAAPSLDAIDEVDNESWIPEFISDASSLYVETRRQGELSLFVDLICLFYRVNSIFLAVLSASIIINSEIHKFSKYG